MKSVATLIAFKVSWLCIVFGAVWSMEWLGLLAIILFTGYEVVIRQRHTLLLPAIIVGILGYAVDNAYVATQLLSFSEPGIALAPYWMALLWVNFALIVEHGLAYLKGKPALAATLGAIGGPLAYLSGVRLGLIEFVAPDVVALAVIAATWALAMPLLMHFLGGSAQRDVLIDYVSTD
ncbi:MAG: DUF2878 domain-containing protein [Gammaproteobacteria bacterium]